MPDHVHLLIEQAPQFGIHKLAKSSTSNRRVGELDYLLF